MVKVYKTNVDEPSKAKSILDVLRKNIPGCDPSFDLENYDKVLRVEVPSSDIKEKTILETVHNLGYSIETLP